MGADKAMVAVGGRPMVAWVADALEPVAGEVVLVGREGPAVGVPAIPDLRPGTRGPLAGLAAALRHAAGRPVLLVAVDQPLVRRETLERLVALLDGEPVVPIDGGIRQTTCAVYPPSLATAAVEEDADGGSIQSLLGRVPHRGVVRSEWVGWGEDGRSWHSVDTPAEAADVLGRYEAAGAIRPPRGESE